MALTSLTALVALEDTAKLKSGETILIQGGAGGVAGFAIQLAKHLGATVITTASARGCEPMSGSNCKVWDSPLSVSRKSWAESENTSSPDLVLTRAGTNTRLVPTEMEGTATLLLCASATGPASRPMLKHAIATAECGFIAYGPAPRVYLKSRFLKRVSWGVRFPVNLIGRVSSGKR